MLGKKSKINTKLLKFVFILCLFGYNLNAQDYTKAREIFKLSEKAFEMEQYKKTIQLIGEVKLNLGNNTNPDLIYLEAKARLEYDKNLNVCKELLKSFLKLADEQDNRRTEVLSLFVKSNSICYENGNRIIKTIKCNTSVNDGDCKDSEIFFNENGERLFKLDFETHIIKKMSINTNLLGVLTNSENNQNDNTMNQVSSVTDEMLKVAGLNYDFIFSYYNPINTNEIIQKIYYILSPASYNYPRNLEFKNVKMPNDQNYKYEDLSILFITSNTTITNNFIPIPIKEYLKNEYKVDADDIGMVKKFTYNNHYKKSHETTIEMSDDFQELYKYHKKKKYKLDVKNKEWIKVKK